MKKVFSIICLASLAICFAGTYPIFSLYKHTLKNEMRRFLEQNSSELNLELIEFRVSKGRQPDFEILDKGKEIRVDDVMYDVVKKQTTETEEIFFCIKDKKETSLLQRFRNVLITNTNSFPVSRQAATVLAQFFSQNYLPVEVFNITNVSHDWVKNSFRYKEIFSLFSPEIFLHPPEVKV